MVSKEYINNIYNKSKGEIAVLFGKYYCIALELPNGKVIASKPSTELDVCVADVKAQIKDYEEYIEMDKRAFDYELAEEYYNE